MVIEGGCGLVLLGIGAGLRADPAVKSWGGTRPDVEVLINETGGAVLGITEPVAVKMCGATVPGAQTALLGVYDPNDTTCGGIETGAELDPFKICNTLVLILEVSDCVSGMKAYVLVNRRHKWTCSHQV